MILPPFLSDLWYNDNQDSRKHQADYDRAINICLEENYYQRLGKWCKDHGISLMGHPASSMDIVPRDISRSLVRILSGGM